MAIFCGAVLVQAALDTYEALETCKIGTVYMYVHVCVCMCVLTSCLLYYDQASTNSCSSVKLPDSFSVTLSSSSSLVFLCSRGNSVFSTLTCPLVLFFRFISSCHSLPPLFLLSYCLSFFLSWLALPFSMAPCSMPTSNPEPQQVIAVWFSIARPLFQLFLQHTLPFPAEGFCWAGCMHEQATSKKKMLC